MLNQLRNVLFYSALTAASAVGASAYAQENNNAPATDAAAVVGSASGTGDISTSLVETSVPISPAPVDLTPRIDSLDKTVADLSTSINGIKQVVDAREKSYDSLAQEVDAFKGNNGSEALDIVARALTHDLNRVRGLKVNADDACATAVTAYAAAIESREQRIANRLAISRQKIADITNNTNLSFAERAARLRESYAPASTAECEPTLVATTADDCVKASAKYQSAASELQARIGRNLTRRGQFALEASVGYLRYGFAQGEPESHGATGANLGTVTGAGCYDAPGLVEVCAEGGFVFGGKSRATSQIHEGPSTVSAGADYHDRTSVAGTQVTKTNPQYSAGLRVMSPDLSARKGLDFRFGAVVQGILGEESVQTDRTRTNQLETANGTALGAPHVVSDSDVQARNYVDFVPQGVIRAGTPHLYGQLSAGYSTRLENAVVGAGVGFKLDF